MGQMSNNKSQGNMGYILNWTGTKITYQNVWDVVKEVLRRKCIGLNICIQKRNISNH